MTDSNDRKGKRTCDLPAYSAMPQPTAPTHTLISSLLPYIKSRPFNDKRQSTIWMNINFLTFGSHTYDLHVCTDVRMHASMYACMYICTYVCTHVCKHVFTYVCVYVCATYPNIYMHLHTHVCMYVGYVQMSVWVMYVHKFM
jgi:hypothetical protein